MRFMRAVSKQVVIVFFLRLNRNFLPVFISKRDDSSDVILRCLWQRTFLNIMTVITEKRRFTEMLSKNIKAKRKAKGLSQEELAVKLNVVRQTISKWEQGLSVPDSDMLISLSEILETPVSVLLGETVIEPTAEDIKVISEKLEVINLQLARQNVARQKLLHIAFIIVSAFIVAAFAVLLFLGSPYLGWNFSDPETAVVGTGFHIFEWVFVRIAPLALIGAIIGTVLTRKKA